MKVTNNSAALQGVWFSGELKWIKPGGSFDGEMTADEVKLLEGNDLLDTSGKASAKKPDAAPAPAVA